MRLLAITPPSADLSGVNYLRPMNPTPVAIVADGRFYVGPDLCRILAGRGFDLVVGDADPNLVTDIASLGRRLVSVPGGSDLAGVGSTALVEAAQREFGRIDSAVAFSGDIVTGRFVKSSVDDLRKVLVGCVEAPYNFMRAVVPPMMEVGQGQVLIITSASAARPTPGASG